ncbi:MAG: hydrogenase maturation nickel metallochaperone HypA [Meiothermus sp.]|nr:hydrogenase maturation nickel metallochaperone HypA [Meiothermus sp.]
MHETSIALELVRSAGEIASRYGACRVSKVGVRIGVLSSVVPEALEFAFPGAALGTALEGAVLQIERVGAVACCAECGEVEIRLERGLRCPLCGRPTPRIVQGEELELDTLELEE